MFITRRIGSLSTASKAATGKLLVLLDGWDEVPTNREHLKQEIEAFIDTYSQCRVYLTSRIAGYVPLTPKAEVKEWELVSFTPEQIDIFVHGFFGGNAEAKKTYPIATAHKAKGEQLVRLLIGTTTPQLQGLARVPLILALLCRLHWQNESLPRRRREIYQKCLKGLLTDWRKEVPNDRIEAEGDVDHKLDVLSDLSLFLLVTEGQANAWKRDRVLKGLQNVTEGQRNQRPASMLLAELVRDGVLIQESEKEEALFRFLHLTFHEYLTARALATRLNVQRWEKARITINGRQVSVAEFLDRKAWDPAWQEVLILLVGQLDAPEPLLKMLSTAEPTPTNPPGDDMFRHRLALAAQCMAELDVDQRERASELLAQITKQVFELWWEYKNTTEPAVMHLTRALPALAQVNAQMGSERLLDSIAALLRHDDIGVRSDAATAVSALGPAAATPEILAGLLSVLRHTDTDMLEMVLKDPSMSAPAKTLTDVIRSALLPLLCDINFDKDMRLIVRQLMEQLNNEDTDTSKKFFSELQTLLRDADNGLRIQVIEKIKLFGLSGILTTLLHVLRDSVRDTRSSAAKALGRLGSAATTPEILSGLFLLLRDTDKSRRSGAAQAAGELGRAAATPEFLSGLVPLLRDPDKRVQSGAFETVGELGSAAATPQILEALLPLLRDPDEWVRWCATETVGKLGSMTATPEILAALLPLLRDVDEKGYSIAVEVVGQLGRAAATPVFLSELLSLLKDREKDVRDNATQAVGQLGSAAATPEILAALLLRLRDTDRDVRGQAIRAVGQLGSAAATPEILAALLDLLRDVDWRVQRDVPEALGQLGSAAATPETLAVLLSLLRDPDKGVRLAAFETLGRLGSAAATPGILAGLLPFLHDPDTEVRSSTAQAIGRLGSTAATPEILAALVPLLHDAERDIQENTLWAVGQLGRATSEILSALLALLRDTAARVQENAAKAVGELGSAAATPEILAALLDLLPHEKRESESEEDDVESEERDPEEVVLTLGKLGRAGATPKILAALLDLLHSEKTDPASVAQSLGKLGRTTDVKSEFISSLFSLLRDADKRVQQNAAEVVGELGSTAATPEILTALLDLLRIQQGEAPAIAAKAVEILHRQGLRIFLVRFKYLAKKVDDLAALPDE